ncbi:MAG: hypothetical protein IPM46_06575 [Flavobacteriales bacterium]|nr:hypothetical protein [Flavobacteriales bacterium]
MRGTLVLVSWLLWLGSSAQWRFEGNATPTWEEAIERYKELDRNHSGARLLEIGADDDGSPIHLFIISDGSGFTPDSIRTAGKRILWVTNGIHPGEPDGIDASLLLSQALLESDQYMGLLANTAVCIVPVYNVSGARQRSATSRANQNGPMEYGFRGNARNLDLNRDFAKVDSHATASLLEALRLMDPDIYFETHVSNGADHRYVMELLTTLPGKLDGGLGRLLEEKLVPDLHAWMERRGQLMCPYFECVGETPEEGLYAFYDSPRYSSGYNALMHRIGILSESHMLKPYADRVNATFQLLLATLDAMERHGEELARLRSEAKRRTAARSDTGLNWKLDTTAVESLAWLGYSAEHVPSTVSGLQRLRYDRSRPTEITVPWMKTYRPSLTKQKPKGYLIPKAWSDIALRLRQHHGIEVMEIKQPTSYSVEQDSIGAMRTVKEAYEGHYLHRDIMATSMRMKHTAQPGDWFVQLGRETDRLVMELLEPQAEDSYFAWGLFDSALQQKEWFSDYVFEDIAAELLAQDPALRAALKAKRTADPAFAADAWAQLCFVYQRSPWFEKGYRRYPVLRVVD